MTTKDQAVQITKDNLYHVFGELDTAKRTAALSKLWVPSSEALFIDAIGVFKGHEAISGMVVEILTKLGPGHVFTELSPVELLAKDELEDRWVTRLKWGFGPPGEKDVPVTGEDVVTIVGGKVKMLYTFLDQK